MKTRLQSTRTAALIAAAFATMLTAPTPARAVDGCKVLLCMAGNWKQIAPCQSEVRQALRDIARGRGWPECKMGGAGNGTAGTPIPPTACPIQYQTTRIEQLESGTRETIECPYTAVVTVAVNGVLWSKTWSSPTGETVTYWTPAARAGTSGAAGALDDQFDLDYAAWLARQAATPTPATPADPSTGA